LERGKVSFKPTNRYGYFNAKGGRRKGLKSRGQPAKSWGEAAGLPIYKGEKRFSMQKRRVLRNELEVKGEEGNHTPKRKGGRGGENFLLVQGR